MEIYTEIQVFLNINTIPESLRHYFSISHEEKKWFKMMDDSYLYGRIYPSVLLITGELSFSLSIYVCV